MGNEEKLWAAINELQERVTALEATKKKYRKVGEGEPSGVAMVRETFLRSFSRVFDHAYAGWGAKENALAKSWLTSVPLEKALEYATIYPQWKDKAIVRAGHPFSLLIARYVQLDAHMKRHPKIVADLIAAIARERVEIDSKVGDYESRVWADIQAKRNPLISGGVQDALQNDSEQPVLGTRDEPT